MEKLEAVELLRSKTGVSYEQAKEALEYSNYDVLDAIVYLEKNGLVDKQMASYSTTASSSSREFEQAQKDYEKSCRKNTVKESMGEFFEWCKKVIKKGCDTSFEVTRKGSKLISIPVIILVICALAAFWVVIPLMIVGMFMECKYKFVGFENTSIDINEMCDKASDMCESIKADIKKDNNGAV